MEANAILETFAQVAATLVGFTGVVFAIGSFSQGGLSPAERHGLLHLLVPAAIVLFLSLLPMVVSNGAEPGPLFWRAFNGLLGGVHLLTLADATRSVLSRQVPEPIPIHIGMVVIGYTTVVANFIVVLGFISELAVLVYLISLLWFLVVSVTQFMLLILSHVHDNQAR